MNSRELEEVLKELVALDHDVPVEFEIRRALRELGFREPAAYALAAALAASIAKAELGVQSAAAAS